MRRLPLRDGITVGSNEGLEESKGERTELIYINGTGSTKEIFTSDGFCILYEDFLYQISRQFMCDFRVDLCQAGDQKVQRPFHCLCMSGVLLDWLNSYLPSGP